MNQKALILIILISTTMATCGVMRPTTSTSIPVAVGDGSDKIVIKNNSGVINITPKSIKADTIRLDTATY